MKIGIDISQVVYEGTGVGKYVKELTSNVISLGHDHTFILFGSSYGRYTYLQKYAESVSQVHKNVRVYIFPFPLWFFEVLWNTLHIISIERFIGQVDVFWSSDWVQPPLSHAKGITTIHDLSIIRDTDSFRGSKIVSVHKQRLTRALSECSHFLCDSYATMLDAHELLHIAKTDMSVIYPGFTRI